MTNHNFASDSWDFRDRHRIGRFDSDKIPLRVKFPFDYQSRIIKTLLCFVKRAGFDIFRISLTLRPTTWDPLSWKWVLYLGSTLTFNFYLLHYITFQAPCSGTPARWRLRTRTSLAAGKLPISILFFHSLTFSWSIIAYLFALLRRYQKPVWKDRNNLFFSPAFFLPRPMKGSWKGW